MGATTPITPEPGRVWTIEAICALGATTDVATASAIIGIGRTKGYQLAKAGEFPTPVLHVGRRYFVPIPGLLALLGAEATLRPAGPPDPV